MPAGGEQYKPCIIGGDRGAVLLGRWREYAKATRGTRRVQGFGAWVGATARSGDTEARWLVKQAAAGAARDPIAASNALAYGALPKPPKPPSRKTPPAVRPLTRAEVPDTQEIWDNLMGTAKYDFSKFDRARRERENEAQEHRR